MLLKSSCFVLVTNGKIYCLTRLCVLCSNMCFHLVLFMVYTYLPPFLGWTQIECWFSNTFLRFEEIGLSFLYELSRVSNDKTCNMNLYIVIFMLTKLHKVYN